MYYVLLDEVVVSHEVDQNGVKIRRQNQSSSGTASFDVDEMPWLAKQNFKNTTEDAYTG